MYPTPELVAVAKAVGFYLFYIHLDRLNTYPENLIPEVTK
jgi:hypothetical protein